MQRNVFIQQDTDCHLLSSHRYCLTFFLSKKILRDWRGLYILPKKAFQISPLNIYKGEKKEFLLVSCFGRADCRSRAQQQNCCTCSCATVRNSWWWLAQQQPIHPTYFTMRKKRASCTKKPTKQTMTACSLHFSHQTLGRGIFLTKGSQKQK